MQPFVTFRDKDISGELQYYILQRDFPHIVGLLSAKPKEKKWQSAIAGYSLWVIFDGTLRGNFIPDYRNIANEIQVVIDSMATWFVAERILQDVKKYKKFKINSDVSIPTE